MSMWDQSYAESYPEQVSSAVFESPNFTEDVDLGPAQPLQGGEGGFQAHHGVLLIFAFAFFGLVLLQWLFRTHNLG